jgi:predicted ATPase
MSTSQWFSLALKDGRFDPEGGDVAEFLYNYGAKFKLLEGSPMIHPNTKLHQAPPDFMPYGIPLIEQVNAWLDEISPGARFCVDRVKLSDDEESYVVKIGFGEESDMRQFKPQNVGLGISYVLPVLATLLTALPDAIILIENPEAHIHPRGQAKLGELIARAAAYGVQVFVETHSDHIINGVRVAVRDGVLKPEDVNIAFFERKERLKDNAKNSDDMEIYSEIRNIKIDDNGSLSEYPEDFMDEWNNQLLELM